MSNKIIAALEESFDLNIKKWPPTQLWQLGKWLYEQDRDKDFLKVIASHLDLRNEQKWSSSKLQQLILFHQNIPFSKVYNRLSWTHYLLLLSITKQEKRNYYLDEAHRQSWSCGQLKRQLFTQQYERYLATSQLGIKSHYIIEFAKPDSTKDESNESRLEQALIDSLQVLLLEFGPGFSFVARQKLIKMPSGTPFFIDLVLYHTYQHCTVLVELKTHPLSHRDIGQLDTYVRLYNAYYRAPNDQPTIGLLLGPSFDQNLLVYSALADNSRLFAARYSYEK